MAKTKNTTKKSTKTVEHIVEDRTVTFVGLDKEIARRRLNKERDVKVRPANFIYGRLSTEEMTTLRDGQPVVLEFSKRTVTLTAHAKRTAAEKKAAAKRFAKS